MNARGVIRGKIIELDRDPGLGDGEEVQVQLMPAPKAKAEAWGEGILRSAGGWSGFPELDDVFDEIQRSRADERRAQGLG